MTRRKTGISIPKPEPHGVTFAQGQDGVWIPVTAQLLATMWANVHGRTSRAFRASQPPGYTFTLYAMGLVIT